MEKIYILLPVHNRKAITRGFIECLKLQTCTKYHLVLIDDGSTDHTADMVQAHIPDATVLRGQGNWWWAGSLQQGVNWLEKNQVDGKDIIMFANDDIKFEAGFLDKAVEKLKCRNATLMLPQVLDEKTGSPQESGVEADMKSFTFKTASTPEKINCLPTRGLFMRMDNLRIIGGFHPGLLPHYLSDYEFTMRAYRKGMKLRTFPDLLISFDRAQTGFRSFENPEFLVFLKQFFSKKSVLNPLYQTTFILLTSPLLYIPSNILKVWKGALILLIKQALRALSNICTKSG